MKKLFLVFLILVFSFPGQVLASTARSQVETQVGAGEAQIYQSVETTVDGETIRKETREPGKLELEMKKTGEGQPTVTFSQETQSATQTVTQTPIPPSPASFISQIMEFFRNLFSHLTK